MIRTNADRQASAWRRNKALTDPGVGLLDAEAPDTWTDERGQEWRTPRTKNALNATRSAGHRALKEFVHRRDGGRCRWCAGTYGLALDHIISRRCGGAHHPGNLQVLCDMCNGTKAALVDSHREAVA